jgi:protein MpaA
MQNLFVTFPFVSKDSFDSFVVKKQDKKNRLEKFCSQVDQFYKSKPRDIGGPCHDIQWNVNLQSAEGYPLIYYVFGDASSKDTTLILGGVHPDEITPIPLALRFSHHLKANPEIYKNTRVVMAPIVNPDGVFKKKPSRTNQNGVDLNRNFFTKDWYATAKSWWQLRRRGDLRHFPGWIPNSEIETLFQIYLIENFRPSKIISIHAPLGFYDYDGPGDQAPRKLTPSEQKARALVEGMSKNSKNYKVVDYSFYPGSLGNYAGNERGIPTITLELDTIDPKHNENYWQRFSPALEHAIQHHSAEISKTPASLFLSGLEALNSERL